MACFPSSRGDKNRRTIFTQVTYNGLLIPMSCPSHHSRIVKLITHFHGRSIQTQRMISLRSASWSNIIEVDNSIIFIHPFLHSLHSFIHFARGGRGRWCLRKNMVRLSPPISDLWSLQITLSNRVVNPCLPRKTLDPMRRLIPKRKLRRRPLPKDQEVPCWLMMMSFLSDLWSLRSSFGQVVPMCSDDEWLAAEAAKPSSQLNLAKTKVLIQRYRNPSLPFRAKLPYSLLLPRSVRWRERHSIRVMLPFSENSSLVGYCRWNTVVNRYWRSCGTVARVERGHGSWGIR